MMHALPTSLTFNFVTQHNDEMSIMKALTQLTVTAAMLGMSGLSHAALTTTVGPVNFNGTAAVTATATNALTATANNNNATAANVALGQFNAATGVLTGASLTLDSNRTQTISGGGTKSMGPGRTANGSGTSTAALTAFGVNTTYTPAITQAGTGCSLAMGMSSAPCSWGPKTSATTATGSTTSVNNANLNSYVGGGTVNAALTLPSLSATSTLSSTMGMGTSTSTSTYSVAWSGSVQADYTYLLHAAPSFAGGSSQSSLTLNFGTVLQNATVSPLAFGLYNLADPNRDGVNLDSFTPSGNSSTLSTNLVGFTNLLQGDSKSFAALLNTSAVGLFNAQYVLNLSDFNVGGNAASNTLNHYQLTLNLTGNVAAVPEPEEYAMLLLGFGMVGFQVRRKQQQLSA